MSELDGFEVMPYINQRTNKGKIAARDKRIEQLEGEIGGTRTISIPSLAFNYVDNRLESIGYQGELYVRQRALESYGQVPEQGERENGGERESCGEACGDDRFELIDKAKRKLLECTNIESRPEEVAVLDNILFRCWQLGWLDKLRDDNSRYFELFGTPERAARTIADISERVNLDGIGGDYDALLGWLRVDA